MGRTKREIINEMYDEMPFHCAQEAKRYIAEAMQIYADQEAKAYANWLSHQVIAGRTAEKLFADYKKEIGPERS